MLVFLIRLCALNTEETTHLIANERSKKKKARLYASTCDSDGKSVIKRAQLFRAALIIDFFVYTTPFYSQFFFLLLLLLFLRVVEEKENVYVMLTSSEEQ